MPPSLDGGKPRLAHALAQTEETVQRGLLVGRQHRLVCQRVALTDEALLPRPGVDRLEDLGDLLGVGSEDGALAAGVGNIDAQDPDRMEEHFW